MDDLAAALRDRREQIAVDPRLLAGPEFFRVAADVQHREQGVVAEFREPLGQPLRFANEHDQVRGFWAMAMPSEIRPRTRFSNRHQGTEANITPAPAARATSGLI